MVVNDLGGSRDGTGHSDAALAVVEEIKTAGGTAMADGSSVTEYEQMQAMVARAKSEWGSVDILINNAGILRDKTFAKMEPADFDLVVQVHLIGAANATKAVWETMREQAYGRILMTASSTGLYGNFGQTNYGAAKLGLAGFTKSLYLEGAKYNIRVNTLAPTAGTRMTQDIFPEEAFKLFAPENVVPAALYLVSEDAPSNAIVAAGAGVVASAYVTLTPGVALPENDRTPEAVAAAWAQITSREGEVVPSSGAEQSGMALKALQEAGFVAPSSARG